LYILNHGYPDTETIEMAKKSRKKASKKKAKKKSRRK
jgi:hypothetical protein